AKPLGGQDDSGPVLRSPQVSAENVGAGHEPSDAVCEDEVRLGLEPGEHTCGDTLLGLDPARARLHTFLKLAPSPPLERIDSRPGQGYCAAAGFGLHGAQIDDSSRALALGVVVRALVLV